jgi:hypothetical protein
MSYHYNFNQNLYTEHYTINIDKRAQYGYFENCFNRTSGGLWFKNNTLIDYSGVPELPKQIHEALTNEGYNIRLIKHEQ